VRYGEVLLSRFFSQSGGVSKGWDFQGLIGIELETYCPRLRIGRIYPYKEICLATLEGILLI
jgi:hypothetical protein